MFTQVLDEVVPISDLRRMRECPLHGIRVSTGAIPAHHVNFLVFREPGEDCFGGAICQEIERLASLKIDENRCIPVPTPDGEIINPQYPHWHITRRRNGTQIAQQGWRFDLHPQSWSQALTYLSAGREPQGLQLLQKTITHPRPGLD